MAALVEWIVRNGDIIITIAVSAVTSAITAWVVLRLSHATKKQSQSDEQAIGSGIETMPLAALTPAKDASVKPSDAAANSSTHSESAVRSILTTVFRSISGLVMGLVILPLSLLKSGWLALAVGLSFGVGSCFLERGFRAGFGVGLALGVVGWICGFPAYLAVEGVRDGRGKDEVRDSVVGLMCGAVTGLMLLFILALVLSKKIEITRSSVTVALAFGAISGLLAAHIRSDTH